MKNTPLLAALLLGATSAVTLIVIGIRNTNDTNAYHRVFDNAPPQTLKITLTEGSLLALTGSKGTQYCPWYVQRNAMLKLPGLKDLTISDGKTVLQIDGRNIVQKNLISVDDTRLTSNDERLRAVFDTRCSEPLTVTNAKLHPLWGK